MIEIKDIEKLAELSRIEMTDVEKKDFQKEIESILAYVGDIQRATSKDSVQETPIVRNVFREDGTPHASGIHTEALLKEAPESKDGFVKVKNILS